MNAALEMLRTLWERGGWVMVPLLVLSVVAVALLIERGWFWMRTHGPGRAAWLGAVAEGLRRDQRETVERLVRRDRSVYGAMVRRLLDDGAEEAVAVEVVEEQRPRFERFMTALSTVITAAPLLGILGTVSGIIGSFELLGEELVTDPREVSGGIAEALLTTEVGLIIALGVLFPYMWFRSQVERALGRMEWLIAAARRGDRHSN